jgi:hypothetical protein
MWVNALVPRPSTATTKKSGRSGFPGVLSLSTFLKPLCKLPARECPRVGVPAALSFGLRLVRIDPPKFDLCATAPRLPYRYLGDFRRCRWARQRSTSSKPHVLSSTRDLSHTHIHTTIMIQPGALAHRPNRMRAVACVRQRDSSRQAVSERCTVTTSRYLGHVRSFGT